MIVEIIAGSVLVGILAIFLATYTIDWLHGDFIKDKSKLKIVEETKSNGNKSFIIYKMFFPFYKKTSKSFDNYNNAFDFLVNHADNRIKLIDKEKGEKVVSRKNRLLIK
jgi:hypothetical protein